MRLSTAYAVLGWKPESGPDKDRCQPTGEGTMNKAITSMTVLLATAVLISGCGPASNGPATSSLPSPTSSSSTVSSPTTPAAETTPKTVATPTVSALPRPAHATRRSPPLHPLRLRLRLVTAQPLCATTARTPSQPITRGPVRDMAASRCSTGEVSRRFEMIDR
jgi:hypothetical protein